MLLQQFEAYASSSITARDCFETQSRGIHSGSVAAAFPFKPHGDGSGGFNIGRSGYRPVFMNSSSGTRSGLTAIWWSSVNREAENPYATKTLLSIWLLRTARSSSWTLRMNIRPWRRI